MVSVGKGSMRQGLQVCNTGGLYQATPGILKGPDNAASSRKPSFGRRDSCSTQQRSRG